MPADGGGKSDSGPLSNPPSFRRRNHRFLRRHFLLLLRSGCLFAPDRRLVLLAARQDGRSGPDRPQELAGEKNLGPAPAAPTTVYRI